MHMKHLKRLVLAATFLLTGFMSSTASADAQVGWHLLGKFLMVSGQMRVSDPWYEKAPPGSVFDLSRVLAVRNGQWQAAVHFTDEGRNGIRVAELVALHVTTQAKSLKWSPEVLTVSVDSGMAGFCDDQYFRDVNQVPRWYVPQRLGPKPKVGDAWSDYVTEELISEREAKIIPFGVLSHTGEGDGTYDVHVARGADGRIEGVRLIYLKGEDPKRLRKSLQILFGQTK
ncbi:DUF4241 domain-containing protein [Myxococcus stipitatus]|uniref:DUF4241 domain-containing protein n=1 Tax=Myxococcus stipitatus TaxID=83455 RepID=UPI003144ED59